MITWREGNLLREETSMNEEKIVGYREYHKELRDLDRKYRDTYVSIYNMSFDYDEPIHLGINWAAAGTVETDKALKFASDIRRAVKDCENFKYNGYTVDWSKD